MLFDMEKHLHALGQLKAAVLDCQRRSSLTQLHYPMHLHVATSTVEFLCRL